MSARHHRTRSLFCSYPFLNGLRQKHLPRQTSARRPIRVSTRCHGVAFVLPTTPESRETRCLRRNGFRLSSFAPACRSRPASAILCDRTLSSPQTGCRLSPAPVTVIRWHFVRDSPCPSQPVNASRTGFRFVRAPPFGNAGAGLRVRSARLWRRTSSRRPFRPLRRRTFIRQTGENPLAATFSLPIGIHSPR